MKKRIYFMLFGLLLAGCTNNDTSASKDSTSPSSTSTSVSVVEEKKTHLRPIGRYYIEENQGKEVLYFANSCSGFEVSLNAKSEQEFKFTLNGQVTSPYQTQFIKAYIDGECVETLEVTKGTKEYALKTKISKGAHVIKILKLNEPAFSKIGLVEIKSGDYEFVDFEKDTRKKIEFYGDSITCGYGNLTDNTHSFEMETEDGTLAYTQLCADKLNYQNSVVSYSGIAMALSPFNSNFTMLDRYKTIDGARNWDFEKYIPDVIVINIGTNDNTKFKQLSAAEQEQQVNVFFTNLKTMALDLQSKAPKAKFVFPYNMMTELHSYLVTCLESTANELNKNNADCASTLEFPHDNGGADGHPSGAGHERFADILASYIEML